MQDRNEKSQDEKKFEKRGFKKSRSFSSKQKPEKIASERVRRYSLPNTLLEKNLTPALNAIKITSHSIDNSPDESVNNTPSKLNNLSRSTSAASFSNFEKKENSLVRSTSYFLIKSSKIHSKKSMEIGEGILFEPTLSPSALGESLSPSDPMGIMLTPTPHNIEPLSRSASLNTQAVIKSSLISATSPIVFFPRTDLPAPEAEGFRKKVGRESISLPTTPIGEKRKRRNKRTSETGVLTPGRVLSRSRRSSSNASALSIEVLDLKRIRDTKFIPIEALPSQTKGFSKNTMVKWRGSGDIIYKIVPDKEDIQFPFKLKPHRSRSTVNKEIMQRLIDNLSAILLVKEKEIRKAELEKYTDSTKASELLTLISDYMKSQDDELKSITETLKKEFSQLTQDPQVIDKLMGLTQLTEEEKEKRMNVSSKIFLENFAVNIFPIESEPFSMEINKNYVYVVLPTDKGPVAFIADASHIVAAGMARFVLAAGEISLIENLNGSKTLKLNDQAGAYHHLHPNKDTQESTEKAILAAFGFTKFDHKLNYTPKFIIQNSVLQTTATEGELSKVSVTGMFAPESEITQSGSTLTASHQP